MNIKVVPQMVDYVALFLLILNQKQGREHMNDNWNYNEKKPEKTVLFVLVTIILIMIIAILGLVFFKLLKGDKSPQTAESSITTTIAETTQTTTEATTTTTETTTKKTTTKKVTTTKETTTPAPTTVKATAPPATASIKVEPQSINGNGTCLLMTVSGNYSYYTYEIYADCEGTPHTLRKSGTSYEKTYVHNDGSTVSHFVFNVTPYNSDGIAGAPVSLNYNGELSLPPSNYSFVTSCTKYGTIYSPSGSKVDGLTRSYLIDGGAATYERHDLTHGWHVTAVNQYFDGSTYWYELYDSDDGDYYGWVASYNISFY